MVNRNTTHNNETGEAIVSALKAGGVNFLVFMPESAMLSAARLAEKDPSFTYLSVSNEGTGVAVCAGAWLGGKRPAIMMESAGFYLTQYSLARFVQLFGIPILILISFRGDDGDTAWWSRHYGATIIDMIKALRLRYTYISKIDQLEAAVMRVQNTLNVDEYPHILLLGGEFIE